MNIPKFYMKEMGHTKHVLISFSDIWGAYTQLGNFINRAEALNGKSYEGLSGSAYGG